MTPAELEDLVARAGRADEEASAEPYQALRDLREDAAFDVASVAEMVVACPTPERLQALAQAIDTHKAARSAFRRALDARLAVHDARRKARGEPSLAAVGPTT